MQADQDAEADVHPADPARRRQTLLAVLLMTVVGVILLLGYQLALARFDGLLQLRQFDAAIQSARWIGAGVVAGLWLSAGALAWISWRFARAILRDDRFPPADARTIRPVRILRGPAARQRARWLQAIALLLSLIALLGGVLVAQVLWQL